MAKRAPLIIDAQAIRRTAKETGWQIGNHVEDVYKTFAFSGKQPPKLTTREGETRPAIQQSLINWNADLGARDRMNWPGFLAEHRTILSALAGFPRLGRLSFGQVETVCDVVQKLDGFKPTSGGGLVFGSKAAHFHFPAIVPVISSEVREGLIAIEKANGPELAESLPWSGPDFKFGSAAATAASYRNFVFLGNAMARDLDSDAVFGKLGGGLELHAKALEWWVISARA